jgi:hypothetical protein
MPNVLKCGSLNHQEISGPIQPCTVIDNHISRMVSLLSQCGFCIPTWFSCGHNVVSAYPHGFPVVTMWFLYNHTVFLWSQCGFFILTWLSCGRSVVSVYPHGFPVVTMLFPCTFNMASSYVPLSTSGQTPYVSKRSW